MKNYDVGDGSDGPRVLARGALVREHRPAALVMKALRCTFALRLIMLFALDLCSASPSHTVSRPRASHLLLQMFLDFTPCGSARVENLHS